MSAGEEVVLEKAAPTAKANAAATATTFFAGATHFSADYLDKMTLLVENLSLHVDQLKVYLEAWHTQQKESKDVASKPPFFDTTTLPSLPAMHEWTMDLLGEL